MKKIPSMRTLLLVVMMTVPMVALAAGGAAELDKGFGTIGEVVDSFTKNVVRALATLAATLAMAAFFWGIVQYIWGVRDGDSKKVKAGNQFMIWGLIALFVMFSVWGIVKYAQKIFGITDNTIVIPQIDLSPATPRAPTPGSPSGLPSGGGASATPVDCSNPANEDRSCVVSGRVGTCTRNEEGTRGCYVNTGSGTASCSNPYEVRGADGTCAAPPGY
jgi:hypothetical protein